MGLGLKLYVDDHQSRFPAAFVEKRDPVTKQLIGRYDIRFTIGGGMQKKSEHALLTYATPDIRPLNPYVPAQLTFQCPRDKGVPWQSCSQCPGMPDTKWEELGCSYNYNAGQLTRLADTATVLAQQDSEEGMAGKPEDWVPEPSKYIALYEPPARPWGCPTDPAVWVQWHRAKGQTLFYDPATAPPLFLSPIFFVDGHVKMHNFTRAMVADPYHPYEPTKDWTWYRPADNALAAR